MKIPHFSRRPTYRTSIQPAYPGVAALKSRAVTSGLEIIDDGVTLTLLGGMVVFSSPLTPLGMLKLNLQLADWEHNGLPVQASATEAATMDWSLSPVPVAEEGKTLISSYRVISTYRASHEPQKLQRRRSFSSSGLSSRQLGHVRCPRQDR